MNLKERDIVLSSISKMNQQDKPSREIVDPKTNNTLTTQENEDEKRKREAAARQKKIEEAAKRAAEEDEPRAMYTRCNVSARMQRSHVLSRLGL